MIAEVTNTPWGERHAYVLDGGQGTVAKRMHVSPFMGMEQSYRVVASEPGSRLALRIREIVRGRPRRARGGAVPSLRRVELSPRSMTRATLAYPAAGLTRRSPRSIPMPVRLRLKGLRPVPHP